MAAEPGLRGLMCPLSQELFDDPVLTVDGHTYDRGMILGWFRECDRNGRPVTSPETNLELPSRTLIPNIAVRRLVAEWLERLPLALDPDFLAVDRNEVLGRGAFGLVVAGTLSIPGTQQLRVAVKLLPDVTSAEARRMLERELKAHLHAQRAAQGVCHLYGTSTVGGQACLVMKRYESSLRSVLSASPQGLPWAEVARYGLALARTLHELHQVGVVVQDVKPENVLLDRAAHPVIADFGISQIITRATRIQPTSIKGTFNYMAPETFDTSGITGKADVWSLACLLVELTTGSPPWADMQMQQIMMAVVLSKRVPEVPDAVPAAGCVRRCFAFEAGERPDAGEVADALAAANGPAPSGVDAGGSGIRKESQGATAAVRRADTSVASASVLPTAPGKQIWNFDGFTKGVKCVASYLDPKTSEPIVLAGSYDKSVRALRGTTGEQIWKFDGFTDWVTCVASYLDPKTSEPIVLAGSSDTTVRAFKGTTGEQIWNFDGFTKRVTGVAVYLDPNTNAATLFAASHDTTLRAISAT